MTEPVEREVKKVARGRAWYTPFEAIGGVAAVVAAVFGVVVAAALLLWYLV